MYSTKFININIIGKIVCLFFLFLGGQSFAQQQQEELIKKINIKLKKDKDYLNLNYKPLDNIQELAEQIDKIPRTKEKEPFAFKVNDNISYYLVFLKDGIGLDSTKLLYLFEEQISGGEEEGTFTVGRVDVDTTIVIDFEDMYNLKKNHRRIYDLLFHRVRTYILQNEGERLNSLLGLPVNKKAETSLGMTSRNNKDYINYVKANNSFWYPKDPKEQEGQGFVRGGGGEKIPVSFALSFSSLSFTHTKLMNFAMGNASVGLSVRDKLLNILPWQGMSTSAFFRILLRLQEEDNESVDDSKYLDAKLGFRFRTNTRSLATSQPYIFTESPLLHVGNSFTMDFNFTRPFDFPFINFYLATGSKDFSNPYAIIEDNLENYAFFTFTQYQFLISFYWNASDEMSNRFRMDVGAGSFDVYRAYYDDQNNFLRSEDVRDPILPIISFHYNFVPDENPLVGAKAKFFDSQFNVSAWFRIAEIPEDISSLRLEAIFISRPIARPLYEWEENSNGIMFQLKYRYGLR